MTSFRTQTSVLTPLQSRARASISRQALNAPFFAFLQTIQYQIACLLAGVKKAITIVGDPDQSIYGWRSAEVENLDIMIKQFGNVKQVFLERNYRSSSGVLDYALAVISQGAFFPLQSSFPSAPF